MDRIGDAEARLRLLPPIRRARLWRLYAEDGRRFLDLWMDGGRSILGAKGTGIGTAAKAAVDMGLTRPFPSIWEARLEKALLAANPGYAAARFYRNPERALAALAAALPKPASELCVLDPAMRDADPAASRPDAIVLRPFSRFLAAVPDADGPRFGLPLLPCPVALAPGVVLLREDAPASLVGEAVPPLALAAAVRALRELDLLSASYDETFWKRSDRRLRPFFERSGPYLYPRHGREEHDAFFRKALGAGVLVSPEHSLPSIVPADFDDGELAKLAKAQGK